MEYRIRWNNVKEHFIRQQKGPDKEQEELLLMCSHYPYQPSAISDI